jgi:hypothetical protein
MGAKTSEPKKKEKIKQSTNKVDPANELSASIFSNQYELSKEEINE